MVNPSTSSGPGGSPSTSGGSSNGTTASSESGASSGSSSGPIFDMGVKDLGDDTPPGCKGKIDFLFVISRSSIMEQSQAKMIAAFPKFMATIEAKFADFDYHVMVIDGDEEWGLSYCSEDCPVLDCKVGDPCCPVSICPACDPPSKVGDPCCKTQDYPCDLLDEVTACDETIGAGNVFQAGAYAANTPCKIAGDRRYLTNDDPSPAETFACIAQLGTGGRDHVGEALAAAMQAGMSAPGGCNEGFLRDDALLMITLISGYDYDSVGTPEAWADWRAQRQTRR